MSYGSNVIYYYDGSYDGLMCCIFESFQKREMPIAIEPYDRTQTTLFKVKEIYTDSEKAERVKKSIRAKISLEAKELIEEAFLTDLAEKELHILYFMRLGYKLGAKVTEMLDNEDVDALKKAVLGMSREAHLLLGFVRFSDYNGVLMAQITPKNNVLPIIAPHFCDRFSGENFMIYDKNHKVALVYRDGVRNFISADSITPPPATPDEEKYRELWRRFFETIGIEGRYNPQCQRNLCPIRYRENMTEFV
jgi:probable DNA metabolism protein